MKQPKVFGHGPYVGTTGYNNHTRDFFRGLSQLLPLKVRNFTVGKTWNGLNNEPHSNEPYITDEDKELLHSQTVFDNNHSLYDDRIYQNYGEDFKHNVNLILNETNHHYFYQNYKGPKIFSPLGRNLTNSGFPLSGRLNVQ